MVFSRLPAGCRVDASASRPFDSASAGTSAYQRPAASCPLAHFFPFASVCWLVIPSPLVAPPLPCIAFRCTATSRVHPRPPLFVRAGTSSLVAPPLPCIAFRCTVTSRVHPRPPLFVGAGWLVCRILSHRLRLLTPHRLTCCLLRHLCLISASLPSLALPFSSPPLSAPRPSPASSNARCTLPVAALPTATVPSRTALVLQHIRLRSRIVIFTAQPSLPNSCHSSLSRINTTS
jgi:hypothetical protein